MKTHTLTQGTPEWLAYRTQHFNASDAAAMLGISPYKTRSQLLHEMATGLTPEVDAATQRRFDAGHAAEASARPLAEEVIGEELYPVVGSEGKLSASFDGLTMSGTIAWEHKLMNVALADSLANGIIPGSYHPQLEQQLMVSGAEKVLFMATSADKTAMEFAWYTSSQDLRSSLMQGWTQFAIDIENYTPEPAKKIVVAEPVQALPSVIVRVNGSIEVIENFSTFEGALRDFLDNRLIRNPTTDQDFADLDNQIKTLKVAELALDVAESAMLAQVQDVDRAKKYKDMLAKLVRENRLMSEKIVALKKESIRTEIVLEARNALDDHYMALNARIGQALVPKVPVDFAGAIKGKRTIDTMRDAVATELARAKIAANAVADNIITNLVTINAEPEYVVLFPDFYSLVLKAPDDLAAVVQNRIMTHKAKEAERIAAETARITEQERIKAEAKVRAEQWALALEAEKESVALMQQAQAATETVAPEPPAPLETVSENVVIQMPERPVAAPDSTTPPTLTLGKLGERLGFALTRDFLSRLGFEPAARDKSAMLYHEWQFWHICDALIGHIEQAQSKKAA